MSPRDKQSHDDRVREHLANKPTYLAWLHIAISLMGFGVVIAKLLYLFDSARMVTPSTGRSRFGHWVGTHDYRPNDGWPIGLALSGDEGANLCPRLSQFLSGYIAAVRNYNRARFIIIWYLIQRT